MGNSLKILDFHILGDIYQFSTFTPVRYRIMIWPLFVIQPLLKEVLFFDYTLFCRRVILNERNPFKIKTKKENF